MAAGRKLFAEKGFHGTSLREITADAQANLGAVTYHFKTKEALYHAILEDVLGDLSSRIEAAARGHGTPPERLRGIVQATFGFFTAAPDAPQLVVRELAHGTPPAPFARMARRNLAAVTQVVRDGQKHAVFRDIEPILVAFSL
ncbi:MAG: TetR/AcrR family transcriptional regulator, partial [Gemmatimonadales bacterium]